jgi:hypothetical protein
MSGASRAPSSVAPFVERDDSSYVVPRQFEHGGHVTGAGRKETQLVPVVAVGNGVEGGADDLGIIGGGYGSRIVARNQEPKQSERYFLRTEFLQRTGGPRRIEPILRARLRW